MSKKKKNNVYFSFFEKKIFQKTFFEEITNMHKFAFTKTIRLLALNFYEAIVNSVFSLLTIIYHLIEISLLLANVMLAN